MLSAASSEGRAAFWQNVRRSCWIKTGGYGDNDRYSDGSPSDDARSNRVACPFGWYCPSRYAGGWLAAGPAVDARRRPEPRRHGALSMLADQLGLAIETLRLTDDAAR